MPRKDNMNLILFLFIVMGASCAIADDVEIDLNTKTLTITPVVEPVVISADDYQKQLASLLNLRERHKVEKEGYDKEYTDLIKNDDAQIMVIEDNMGQAQAKGLTVVKDARALAINWSDVSRVEP